MLGKIIYFVPERKETKGIEIILIKILGIIIFKIRSALTKLSPKIDKILPAKLRMHCMTQKPSFKTRARIINQLGEQLIKNESIALLELIKNSYD